MDIEFKQLAEKDFPSFEAFAAFAEAKVKFSERHQDSSTRLDPRSFEHEDALRITAAEPNAVRRGRLAASLIQDETLPDHIKLAIAGQFFFPKYPSAVETPAVIPSAETYILLHKSKMAAPSDIPPGLKDSSILKLRLEDDLGRMTLDDHKAILRLERQHQVAPADGISPKTELTLTVQLTERLKHADLETDVRDIADQLNILADLTGNYSGAAYYTHHVTKDLPDPWNNPQKVRVNNAKTQTYKDLVTQGLTHYQKGPSGTDRAEQKQILSHQIEKARNFIHDNLNVLQEHPASLIGALTTLKNYQVNLDDKGSNYFAFDGIMEDIKKSVHHSIQARRLSPVEGVGLLIEARMAHATDSSVYNTSIHNDIVSIAHNARPEDALDIYRVYQDKAPPLIALNHGEDVTRSLAIDASERVMKVDGVMRSDMMDAMIDLAKTPDHDNRKSKIDGYVISVFNKLPADDKKQLLGKMIEKDFPESGSYDLRDMVKHARDGTDPAVLRGAALIATKASLNDINTPGDSAKDGVRDLSNLYAKMESTGDRQAIRKMVRTHGADIGLAPEGINGALQEMRTRYKEENNIVSRAANTVKSFFAAKVDMMDLKPQTAGPRHDQKLTA